MLLYRHVFTKTVAVWILFFPLDLWATDTLHPALNVVVSKDNNVTSTNTNPVESVLTLIEPSLGITLKGRSFDFGANYVLSNGDYDSSSEDNFTDHTLTMDADFDFGLRHRALLSTEFLLQHEGRGSAFSKGVGNTLAEPDEFSSGNLGLEYAYGVPSARGGLDFRLGFQLKNYDARMFDDGEGGQLDRTLTRDYQDQSYGATYSWRVSGRTRVLVEANANNIEYDVARADGALDSNETDFVVGITWDVTGKSTGSAKVGYRERDFIDPTLKDFRGPRWLVSMNWTPKTYSEFVLTSVRRSQESNGFGGFIDQTLVTLDWRHSWSSKLRTTVVYSLQQDSYIGAGIDTKERVGFASAKLNYAWRRWCGFRVGVSSRNLDSTNEFYDYDRGIVFMGIGFSL